MSKSKWLGRKLEELNADEKLEVYEGLEESVFGGDEHTPPPALQHIGEFEEEAKKFVENWGKVQGITTGLTNYDALTMGMVPGELIVIAGETSHGKTALAINVAVRVAESGVPVLFVTLEVTKPILTARVMKITDTPLADLPLLYQDRDELNWKDIDKLMRTAKENGVQLVVVDHLHYFTREVERVAEDLGRITKEFKKNANRHELPIILVSHVRKKEKGQRQLGNDDLRGSSYIAQDADVVLFVHKESDKEIKLKITKNRNRGFRFEDSVVSLAFDGARITDWNPFP